MISRLRNRLKLPAKFPDKPKCPSCGGFSTKPVEMVDNIVLYKCRSCGTKFGIRKEEGWKRGLKYAAHTLPIVIKANDMKIILSGDYIRSRLNYGENVARALGVPMYGFSWIHNGLLYAKSITASIVDKDGKKLVNVLLNGYPLYTGVFEKLEGEVKV